MSDCEPLIQKIRDRIEHWSSKFLSYVGRVQLIQAVIFSVQVYRSRHFILPKSVLRHIDQLCSAFLWHGKEQKVKVARVSWSDICHPKSEGGLGMKDLNSWNKTCLMHSVKAILMQEGSLWIAWVKAYNLRDYDFWNVQANSCSSWMWKSILKLRDVEIHFVVRVRNVWRWNTSSGKYRAVDVWNFLRPRKEKVEWSRLIWHSAIVPRHAIIAWMAVLGHCLL